MTDQSEVTRSKPERGGLFRISVGNRDYQQQSHCGESGNARCPWARPMRNNAPVSCPARQRPRLIGQGLGIATVINTRPSSPMFFMKLPISSILASGKSTYWIITSNRPQVLINGLIGNLAASTTPGGQGETISGKSPQRSEALSPLAIRPSPASDQRRLFRGYPRPAGVPHG